MSTPANDRRIDYLEFTTRNLANTKKFFAAAFDWRFIDYGPDYSSFTDGRLSGGFRAVPAPSALTAGTILIANGNPLVVLYATELERVYAAVLAAHGKITKATHEFPGGRRFHFTTPEGLELAVWSDRRANGTVIE